MKYIICCLTIMLSLNSAAATASTDEESIREVISLQQKAWNKGDLAGYMQGYWQSKKLRFASGNSYRFGWKTTLKNYQKNYPNKAAMGTLTFDIIDVNLINDANALVFGRWHLQRDKDTPQGLFTLTFAKIDGQWLITQDHTSSI